MFNYNDNNSFCSEKDLVSKKILTDKQNEELLTFIEEDFRSDLFYKTIKDNVNGTTRYKTFMLYIYLFQHKKININDLVSSKNDFDKIFFHSFRFIGMYDFKKEYFLLLAKNYCDWF